MRPSLSLSVMGSKMTLKFRPKGYSDRDGGHDGRGGSE